MSRIYKVHTTITFPLVEMVNRMTELSMFMPMCGRFHHPTYYFYNYSSLRGVDITAEEDHIEVRTTLLSNFHDHEMAGFILKYIQELTEGIITNDEDEEIYPSFYDGNIYEWIEEDLHLIQVLIQNEGEIDLFGPFGWYDLNNEEVYDIINSKEHAHSKIYQIERLLKAPFVEHFEKLRIV